jgi:hypothetical protein
VLFHKDPGQLLLILREFLTKMPDGSFLPTNAQAFATPAVKLPLDPSFAEKNSSAGTCTGVSHRLFKDLLLSVPAKLRFAKNGSRQSAAGLS